VRLLAGARRILAFTGAGLSTGSGVPDFRGPQGIWTKRPPVHHHEFMASEAARVEYWEYKEEQHEALRSARPNAAHRALVELERRGRLHALVTQNIDGLHQAAGSRDVVEVHGTNRLVECVGCRVRSDPGPAVAAFRAHRRTPTCTECGGWLKFATISFGQTLDPGVLQRACAVARDADLVLALGSTLSVHPAASIPLIPVRAGAAYAIVNQGETEHDGLATLKLDADVVHALPAAVAAMEKPTQS
jgi:NAD-dependent deacetylase